MMMTGLNLDKREKADRNESNDETVYYQHYSEKKALQ
jgi:hypothetical protein